MGNERGRGARDAQETSTDPAEGRLRKEPERHSEPNREGTVQEKLKPALTVTKSTALQGSNG